MSLTSIASRNPSPRYSDEEWALRVDLAAAYRLMAHYGWDDILATHISVRLPGPDHQFLINPFGLLFEEITASSLLKVDLHGNLVEPSDFIANRAAFVVHSAVHMFQPEALCAVHLHTIAGTAVSAQPTGLLPISPPAMIMYGRIGYHDFEGVTVNEDERQRLGEHLGDNWALILCNHGTLAVGRNIAEAVQRMYHLERACQMQIAALSAGPELHLPDLEITSLVKKQIGDNFGRAADMAWAALRRKLDRLCPDYAN
jgi:ribulose-5-phosphate 4-epimerase/fuculose-1-phosphate aldolase